MRPEASFCGSENGERRPNMTGKMNGNYFTFDSTVEEDNLLIQIKHNDVKEKFSTEIGKPSSHDSSYE